MMNRRRWGLGLVGLLLAGFAIWQILAATNGLQIARGRTERIPLTFISPKGTRPESRPLILVGHGFAGSSVLMRGFALALAHDGYDVLLWDFPGHGANPDPLSATTGGQALLSTAESALNQAVALGFGDPGRVAILGHSMGSGVALSFGVKHPETAATIAVSPVSQPVTPKLPRNLLLMAGSLEPPFRANAATLLAQAGGEGGDPGLGTARKLVTIPYVEHISILFSPAAHTAARNWLDATFGSQPGAIPYTDRRIAWYALGIAGILLVAGAWAPLVAGPEIERDKPARPMVRRLGALATGALVATGALWLLSKAGLVLGDLLGVRVGGYLLVWFAVAGLISLLLLRPKIMPPSRHAVVGGLVAFGALWLGVGLLGQLVWLPWLLIPHRLALWPLGALLLVPWFVAAGEMVGKARPSGRLGWWLIQSAFVSGALFLSLKLSPDLGFLVLILPLFPVILGLHAIATAPHRTSWPFALSGALFTAWLLLAVFPLQ